MEIITMELLIKDNDGDISNRAKISKTLNWCRVSQNNQLSQAVEDHGDDEHEEDINEIFEDITCGDTRIDMSSHSRNDSVKLFPFEANSKEAKDNVKEFDFKVTFDLEFVIFISNKDHSPSRLEVNFSVNFSLECKLWLFPINEEEIHLNLFTDHIENG